MRLPGELETQSWLLSLFFGVRSPWPRKEKHKMFFFSPCSQNQHLRDLPSRDCWRSIPTQRALYTKPHDFAAITQSRERVRLNEVRSA